jgi:hypothetical protein
MNHNGRVKQLERLLSPRHCPRCGGELRCQQCTGGGYNSQRLTVEELRLLRQLPVKASGEGTGAEMIDLDPTLLTTAGFATAGRPPGGQGRSSIA